MHEHAKELKLLYRGTQQGGSTNASTRPYRNRNRLVTASTGEYHLQICQSVHSLRFVFDLGKEDLTYYYKLCLKMILQC
jgi:hypothetical protein